MSAMDPVNGAAASGRRSRLAIIGAAGAALLMAVGIALPGGEAGATATVPTLTFLAGTGTSGAPTPGPAHDSALNTPDGIVVDHAGDVYVSDSQNDLIEKITPSGTLSIIAGTGTAGAPVAGPATSSPLETPGGLALDSAGNLYCAEYGGDRIVKITPSGTLSVVAGTGSPGNPTPGPALDSRLDEPAGVAVDHSGNLYIADDTNQRVEKVTPSGTLSVFAGTGGYATAVPGPATSSPLDDPSDVAVNAAGDVYVSMESSVIAKITPSGTLSIVAGSGHYGGATPGPATSSKLEWPFGLSFDGAGDLYFSDYDLSQIFKLTPSGTLSVVAGTGSYGAPTEGPPTTSTLGGPEGVAVDSAGNVYIADTYNNRVEEIRLS